MLPIRGRGRLSGQTRLPSDPFDGLSARLSNGAGALLAVLEAHGALHLNSTPHFPNVLDSGYSWAEVMELVSSGLCYVSRLVSHKTTYLSLYLYQACSSIAPPMPGVTVGLAFELYSALDVLGPLPTEKLAALCLAATPTARRELERLQERFHITVMGPGRRLNDNWDTYVWCTRNQWKTHWGRPIASLNRKDARHEVRSVLGRYLSPRQIANVLLALESG